MADENFDPGLDQLFVRLTIEAEDFIADIVKTMKHAENVVAKGSESAFKGMTAPLQAVATLVAKIAQKQGIAAVKVLESFQQMGIIGTQESKRVALSLGVVTAAMEGVRLQAMRLAQDTVAAAMTEEAIMGRKVLQYGEMQEQLKGAVKWVGLLAEAMNQVEQMSKDAFRRNYGQHVRQASGFLGVGVNDESFTPESLERLFNSMNQAAIGAERFLGSMGLIDDISIRVQSSLKGDELRFLKLTEEVIGTDVAITQLKETFARMKGGDRDYDKVAGALGQVERKAAEARAELILLAGK